jgi:aminopeptidase N
MQSGAFVVAAETGHCYARRLSTKVGQESGADMQTTQPAPIRLADYRVPAFLVDTVDLVFTLDPHATVVRARLGLRRNPTADDPHAPLRLDGEALTLRSLLLDGESLSPQRYEQTATGLLVRDLGEAAELEIETLIAPDENTELSGLYVSGGNFFTQCEAEGFRRITFFPDRPDVMSRYTTTIVADEARYPVLLSNGNLADCGEAEGGRHWVKWEDPHPKPCYLFALVAGDLVAVKDHFITESGRDVSLAIYVRRGDENRCGHAMNSLKASMRWDEQVFGLEYDLEIFNIAAVSDFNMGAMENKGLNIFNTKYVLAQPETATDADYQGIESVIAHEYFHNWTGNRVTCRDWFQLSLKEGLTVFRDQEFSADQGSRAVKRIGDVLRLRAVQFPEDAGPLAHPVRPDTYQKIDNFYTATVYQKGAEVVRMIHTLIGAKAFRKGMDLYFARHDNHAVTIEDFVAAMADASGEDLTQFHLWYVQAGTPEITMSDEYDAPARRYMLTLRQHTPATPGQAVKLPFLIPVALGLLDEDGRDVIPTKVLRFTEAEQSFTFDDVPPLVPSLLRGFSAPVRLFGTTPEQQRFLAKHDSDPFVRLNSRQELSIRVMLDAIAQPTGDNADMHATLIEAVSRALDDTERDPAYVAEAMSLPAEAFLSDQMKVIDVDAVFAVREAARAGIGAALAERLRDTYHRLDDGGVYSIDGEAMGRRHLRNACLWYLIKAEDGVALATAQFNAKRNMTDVLAALALLANTECEARESALDAFYHAWRQDDLVLDKWFAIQAMSRLPGTLARVEALTKHPDFDMKNPNRLRSLIGAFAHSNQVRFHDITGAGYRFVAERLIALDGSNSQVAARQISAFGNWRRHDMARQALMRDALEQIRDTPGLSAATLEMVTRTLG